MEQSTLEELRLSKQKQFFKLTELQEFTRQLAEAVERRDQVSVKMVLSMRQEPLLQAQEEDARLRERLLELPEEEAVRAGALLSGAPAEGPEEQALCEQVARNGRLLQRISALDERLSKTLGGKRSFYDKFRQPPAPK